jgi:rhodanese-related sulfurtransferase
MTKTRSVNASTKGRSPRQRQDPASSGARLTGRQWAIAASGIAVLVVAVVVGWSVASTSVGAPGNASDGTVVQAVGGHWTNVTAAKLTSMLETKDFTLLNVKTPYIGEIRGTDLYIPYTDLKARASELPPDKTAKIIVYCRSGNESAIAAQTLLDLGYANIDNLDGGMIAWTAGGGALVQVSR